MILSLICNLLILFLTVRILLRFSPNYKKTAIYRYELFTRKNNRQELWRLPKEGDEFPATYYHNKWCSDKHNGNYRFNKKEAQTITEIDHTEIEKFLTTYKHWGDEQDENEDAV